MIFQDSELNKLSRLFNQIINETYGLERESLDALSFIPPQAGIGQWLRTWTYKVLSEMGIAKLISDYAEDLPPVSRALELKTNDIREYGVSYGYSEFELMQWLTAGIDLSRDEAETARRKIDEKVDEVLGRLMADGSVKRTIVVGIDNTPDRLRELLPGKIQSYMDEDDIEDPAYALGDSYLKFVTEEVKPFIDSLYRPLTDREHTFIAGSSMGGLISLYALCEYPEVFGGAACLSSHISTICGSKVSEPVRSSESSISRCIVAS